MVVCGATTGPDPDIDIRSLYQRHRRILGAPMGNRSEFRDALSLVAAGELDPQVDRVLNFETAVEGHRALADREVVGNVVVRP